MLQKRGQRRSEVLDDGHVRLCVKSVHYSLTDVEAVVVVSQRICIYHDWSSQPFCHQTRNKSYHSSHDADLVDLHTLVADGAVKADPLMEQGVVG